ncbi:kinase-like protein [Thozetella sp. PMI_491]|nr:kinase-like protein [Thozetella sp. PMI_491]
MDAPGTVFYLVPNNKYATAIVQDPANRDRVRRAPHIDSDVPVLRIGLDQQPKSPPYLVRFGRREHNDVILNKRFSRNDQCYFDFNKDTGELLLHDISEKNDTELCDIIIVTDKYGNKTERPGAPQIWKTPRQCVVVLSPDPYADPKGPAAERQWIFIMRDAEFRLIPRTHGQGEATLTKEKLAFAGQPDPDRTIEGTLQRIFTLGLQSLQSQGLTTTYKSASTITFNPHNTRFRTPLEPEEDDEIKITKLRPLGRGGQGEVHRVVDMYTGAHHACKIVAVKAEVPQWKIYSERDFRKRVEKEVNLVQELKHRHIVPYTHTQGFKIGQDIKIFMPIYEGNLHDLLQQLRNVAPEALLGMTDIMLSQMLSALYFVHTRDPPIIHRDIKPANILYRGAEFLLTDFGIAKVVDTTNTIVGTEWYMAPEVRENREQTPKVDIWGLGVTVVECLVKLKPENERRVEFREWEQWYEYLQTCLNRHQQARPFASMVAFDIDRRPTAYDLLNMQNPTTNAALAGLEVSLLASQANGATSTYSAAPTPMDWTKTAATAFLQGNPQPTHGSMQPSQPNPVVIPSPNVPPSRPAQLGAGRGRSIKSAKSTDGRQTGHKRNRSSQSQPQAPSQPGGVPKRTSRRRQASSKSIHKAQEIQALEIA